MQIEVRETYNFGFSSCNANFESNLRNFRFIDLVLDEFCTCGEPEQNIQRETEFKFVQSTFATYCIQGDLG